MIRESLVSLVDLVPRVVNSLRYNLGLLGLSALLATGLWFFVTSEEDPERTDEFPFALPVEAVSVPENLSVFGTLEPVTIRITAPEDTFNDLEASDFRAVADLANAEAGDVLAPVAVEYTGGRRGIDIEEITPNRVSVNVQPVVERSIPVVIDLIGQVETGFSAVVESADPDSVLVSGPEQAVALVDEIVGEVDLGQIPVGVERFESEVPLLPVSERGFTVEDVVVDTTSATVVVEITRETLERAVPVLVDLEGAPAVGFQVSELQVDPSSVIVSGPLDTLAGIDNITTEPVDISDLDDSTELDAELIVPDGVTLDVRTVTVEVTLEVLDGEADFGVAPTFSNLQAGLTAIPTEPILVIRVSGPLAQVSALSSSDIQAEVDVTGRGPGTYTLNVTIETPEGVEVLEAPAEITVTLVAS